MVGGLYVSMHKTLYTYMCTYLRTVTSIYERSPLAVECCRVLDCGLVVSEFVLQSLYYIHFLIDTLKKGSGWIVPQLFFYKDGFGNN